MLDQSCWYANIFDKQYLAVPDPDKNSIVHTHIKQIKKGVDFHRKNICPASKQCNEYTEAIRELAAGFTKLFLAAQISDRPNSKFSRLVSFWLKEYNQVSIKKPQRHIQKAIGKEAIMQRPPFRILCLPEVLQQLGLGEPAFKKN